MKPCGVPECPALATRGDFCPVHLKEQIAREVEPVSPAETEAAIAQRERIGSLYKRREVEAEC